jgi:hypothetical protein
VGVVATRSGCEMMKEAKQRVDGDDDDDGREARSEQRGAE